MRIVKEVSTHTEGVCSRLKKLNSVSQQTVDNETAYHSEFLTIPIYPLLCAQTFGLPAQHTQQSELSTQQLLLPRHVNALQVGPFSI